MAGSPTVVGASSGGDPTAADDIVLASNNEVSSTKAVAADDVRLSNARTPSAHKSSHQDGGSDEISVTGLSGLLADGQTPLAHHASHQNGGSDEIGTATPAANAIPKADSGGKLDSWITAATTAAFGLVQFAASGVSSAVRAVRADDSRLSDSRTPTAHASSHQHGGSDAIATATPAANAIPKADGSGFLTSWIQNASTTIAGLLTAALYQVLVAFDWGTKYVDLDIEGGTYNANVTTSSLGGAKSRKWDGNTDGSGRYQCDPLSMRTGGNVVFRVKMAISASGSAGKKLVWKLSSQAFDTGDTLPASVLGNAQTITQDIAAVTAKVITDVDFTVSSSVFDQTKSMMNFVLERLASTDANDNYTNSDGEVHVLAIKLIYTGFGGKAAPTAPV